MGSVSRGRSTNEIGALPPHLLAHLGYQLVHLRNNWPKPPKLKRDIKSQGPFSSYWVVLANAVLLRQLLAGA